MSLFQMRDLGTEVQDKMAVFKNVIQNLDTGSPKTLDISERAIQAYEQKPEDQTYYERLKNLEKDDVRACGEQTNAGGTDAVSVLERFGYLAELSMANALCASANRFSGAFLTLKRNCTIADTDPWTCARICQQVVVGSSPQDRGECITVVAAQLQTEASLGAGLVVGNAGKAIGAQTANLGRTMCNRQACYSEFCCCRLKKLKLL